MYLVLLASLFFFPSFTKACYDHHGSPVECEAPPSLQNILREPSIVIPTVTSTCGINGSERVCERSSLTCAICNADRSSPSLMTDSIEDTYWQSQTYNQINQGVNITFNLRKLFHIHNIHITFTSSRPHSFSIHASNNYGDDYFPLQYFSQSCKDIYNLASNPRPSFNITTPSCTSQGVGYLPLRGGRSSLILPSPILATNIQIRLHTLSTLGDERTWNSTVLDSYWYAISNVQIGGQCYCNGHASNCVLKEGIPICQCRHSTTGGDCQMCLASHNDVLWARATNSSIKQPTECQECNCNGRSTTCYYDPQVYLLSGNVTGGVCINCTDNTTGSQCHICKDGFYPNPHSEQLECLTCICDPRGFKGSNGTCANVLELYNGTSCECKEKVKGSTCNICAPGYFNLTSEEGCQECSCNSMGSLDQICDPYTGQCKCKSSQYYGRTCQSCDCHVKGTADLSRGCDRQSGMCSCKRGVGGPKCDRCLHGYYDINQGCLSCMCHINGTVANTTCHPITGQCTCIGGGYHGRDCSMCPNGTHNIHDGCTSCPTCYNRVQENYNNTVKSLEELIDEINKTLSNVEIHPQLRNAIEELYRQLLELRDLQRNLSRRERELRTKLEEVKTDLGQKEREATMFSLQVENTRRSAGSLNAAASSYMTTITGILNRINTINETLTSASANVTSLVELFNRTNAVINNIKNITEIIEKSVMNQSRLVSELLRQALLLSDNTTDLLMSMNEIFDIENSTLDLLRGLSDCSTQELDVLLKEGTLLLNAAAGNTSRVSNETLEQYNRVLELVQFTSNSSLILNRSIETLSNVRRIYNESLRLARTNIRLRQNYTHLYLEAVSLFTRSEELNRTANNILEREKIANSSAIFAINEGEVVISEIEDLLSRLERELQNVVSFLSRVNALASIVEEAEKLSNASFRQTLETKEMLSQITEVVLQSEDTLNKVTNTLTRVTEILLSANMTAINTLVRTDELLNNISNISLNNTEESINSLRERGERDRLAIERTNSVVNTVNKTSNSLETLAISVMQQLTQFETLLNSTSLLSLGSILALNNSLNAHEMTLNELTFLVNDATAQVDRLDVMSATLREKYKNLQLHRDLLRDMRDNLDQLDCENSFV